MNGFAAEYLRLTFVERSCVSDYYSIGDTAGKLAVPILPPKLIGWGGGGGKY